MSVRKYLPASGVTFVSIGSAIRSTDRFENKLTPASSTTRPVVCDVYIAATLKRSF